MRALAARRVLIARLAKLAALRARQIAEAMSARLCTPSSAACVLRRAAALLPTATTSGFGTGLMEVGYGYAARADAR
jgi:hypothetical protein